MERSLAAGCDVLNDSSDWTIWHQWKNSFKPAQSEPSTHRVELKTGIKTTPVLDGLNSPVKKTLGPSGDLKNARAKRLAFRQALGFRHRIPPHRDSDAPLQRSKAALETPRSAVPVLRASSQHRADDDLIASVTIVTLVGGLVKRSAGAVTSCRALLGLGTRRALLISGLVHGLWELPVMIRTSFHHGAGNRLIVMPLFLLTLKLAGVCFSFLRFTTGSVRTAALARGGFNIFWERFDGFTETSSPLVVEYLAGEAAC
jgi:hypothetical protein